MFAKVELAPPPASAAFFGGAPGSFCWASKIRLEFGKRMPRMTWARSPVTFDAGRGAAGAGAGFAVCGAAAAGLAGGAWAVKVELWERARPPTASNGKTTLM